MNDTSMKPDSSSLPARTAARVAALAACAGALQVAESLLPHPLPGVRLGLANVFTMVALAELGFGAALRVAVLRTLAGALALGTLLGPAFVLSLVGAVVSTLVMGGAWAIARRLRGLGVIGVSAAGAAAHVLAQAGLVYLLFVRSSGVLWLMPVLVLAALATGTLTGLVAAQALGRIAQPGLVSPSAEPASAPPADGGPGPGGRLAGVKPELKLAAAILIALLLLVFTEPLVYAGVLALLVLSAASGRVRFAAVLRGLHMAWPVVAAAFVLPVLFSPWGRVVAEFGPVRVTETGLAEGGLFAARLLLLAVAMRLLALVTSPEQLATGVVRLLSPLRRLGFDPARVGAAVADSWAALPAMMRAAAESVRRRRKGGTRLGQLIGLPGAVVADLYFASGTQRPREGKAT